MAEALSIIPRYLSRDQSASYLGVSGNTFAAEVAKGVWPQGMRRGAKDTRVTWDRKLLDVWADQHSGIGVGEAVRMAAQEGPAVSSEELIALERSNATPKNRPAHRSQKAA